MTFIESLESGTLIKGGPLCVGIDPRIKPSKTSFSDLKSFGCRIVDACHSSAAAFKLQLAFFECHGADGWNAMEAVLRHIREIDPDYPVILDAKRGDIGSTAAAYAMALLDRPGRIAVTLSPYLGEESIAPFLEYTDAFAFILCRTTNPGAQILQEKRLENGRKLYLELADEAVSWDHDAKKPQIGLVVAGNDPDALRAVRERHPHIWFLAPGIGAQGGEAKPAIAAGCRSDNLGILVSASRSVTDSRDPAQAAVKLKDILDEARMSAQAGREGFARGRRDSALNDKEDRKLVEGIFRVGAFKTGEFRLKSGALSPFYIDLRRISANSSLLRLCGRAYASLLDDLSYDHIAGIPVSALPLATATALCTGDSLIYPRLEKKAHGTGSRIEGVWHSGEKAVLLDDVITTGGSKLEAAALLRESGIEVERLVVLIERDIRGRTEMERAGIRLRSWKTVEDILRIGSAIDLVDEDTAHRVLRYLEGR
ncbi:MAG: hypothetical protein B6D68_03620 [spirochete symbiont of Stewartia floridana]|nr:MAG: hypothetical protein B6D68_03620 [spirochete symbiont of Stewartia floridana]